MLFRYPTLVTLAGDEYTEESRTPVVETLDPREIVKELASGRKRKYVKAMKRKWSIGWELMPNTSAYTIDGKKGRQDLNELVYSGVFFSIVLEDGVNGTATYNANVTGYTEELVLRRDIQRWKVSLELEEV